MENKLLQMIEERQSELYDLLKSLVNINSENFGTSGNEADVARFIKNYLDGIGVEADLYSPEI